MEKLVRDLLRRNLWKELTARKRNSGRRIYSYSSARNSQYVSLIEHDSLIISPTDFFRDVVQARNWIHMQLSFSLSTSSQGGEQAEGSLPPSSHNLVASTTAISSGCCRPYLGSEDTHDGLQRCRWCEDGSICLCNCRNCSCLLCASRSGTQVG
jgi:hypothetical protein